jgi:glycerol-3-phosphate dehydrogenase
MALGEHVVELMRTAGVQFHVREQLPVPPIMPSIGQATLRPFEDAELISRDPEYGRIVCFCERVSRGEIRDALESVLPPTDIDGLRRRTRALMGRCQGFYCGAEVEALLNEKNAHRGDFSDTAGV